MIDLPSHATALSHATVHRRHGVELPYLAEYVGCMYLLRDGSVMRWHNIPEMFSNASYSSKDLRAHSRDARHLISRRFMLDSETQETRILARVPPVRRARATEQRRQAPPPPEPDDQPPQEPAGQPASAATQTWRQTTWHLDLRATIRG